MKKLFEKIKYSWKCFLLSWKNEKRKEVLEMLERLKNVKRANMEYINKDNDDVKLYSTDDELNIDFAIASFHRLREQIIHTLGNEKYSQNLSTIEPDLALAYKEADFQITRAEYLDAELQYYKAANNPNGPLANMLKKMWDRRCKLKEQLEIFESEIKEKN